MRDLTIPHEEKVREVIRQELVGVGGAGVWTDWDPSYPPFYGIVTVDGFNKGRWWTPDPANAIPNFDTEPFFVSFEAMFLVINPNDSVVSTISFRPPLYLFEGTTAGLVPIQFSSAQYNWTPTLVFNASINAGSPPYRHVGFANLNPYSSNVTIKDESEIAWDAENPGDWAGNNSIVTVNYSGMFEWFLDN